MNITENIANGKYRLKVEYPQEKDPLLKRALVKAFHAEQDRVMELFKQDTLAELGLLNHPKGEKLFGIAWRKGHAYGPAEVWTHMVDFAELLKD